MGKYANKIKTFFQRLWYGEFRVKFQYGKYYPQVRYFLFWRYIDECKEFMTCKTIWYSHLEMGHGYTLPKHAEEVIELYMSQK